MFRVYHQRPSGSVVELYLNETATDVELHAKTPNGDHVLIGKFCGKGFVRSNGLPGCGVPVDESGCIKVV